MSIAENIQQFEQELVGTNCRLVVVTKTHPVERLREAYAAGSRLFGENRVQEMVAKQPELPADIEWHLIGHLQTNKVKYIAPFVHTVESIDSLKLLLELHMAKGVAEETHASEKVEINITTTPIEKPVTRVLEGDYEDVSP